MQTPLFRIYLFYTTILFFIPELCVFMPALIPTVGYHTEFGMKEKLCQSKMVIQGCSKKNPSFVVLEIKVTQCLSLQAEYFVTYS